MWCEVFVNQLTSLGVKYCCISPGSRSTPLTIAFAENKSIKTIINVDERNSAFIALGLAKSSNSPVAIVCTSGTAAAELYPAVIEAYQQRIPLIICTTDRPEYLLNTGANQTINQKNIFSNHIRYSLNSELPSVKMSSVLSFLSEVRKALKVGLIDNRGPVHINFPFEKPLEPESFTDEISPKLNSILKLSSTKIFIDKIELLTLSSVEKELVNDIMKFEKGIIFFGPHEPRFMVRRLTSGLSQITGYPVFADGCSQLRFGQHNKQNIVTNFDSLFRLSNTPVNLKPELVIHFGRIPTSKALEDFFTLKNCKRYVVNDYGDKAGPSLTAYITLKSSPRYLIEKILFELAKKKFKREKSGYSSAVLKYDDVIETYKQKYFSKKIFSNEVQVIRTVLNHLPDKSNLFICNSTPVRDLDAFGSRLDKDIKVYNNRGASGIDGITSTAIGVAVDSKKPTILITGDLSFYYDINTLVNLKNKKLPFIVILINNNGGGLFHALPISSSKKYFEEYFLTKQNIDFKSLVASFGIKHLLINNEEQFKVNFHKSIKAKLPVVLEFRTDSETSYKSRQEFRKSLDTLFR